MDDQTWEEVKRWRRFYGLKPKKRPKPSKKEAGWTAKDCANYCTASFPHPSCKATGRPCAIEAGVKRDG